MEGLRHSGSNVHRPGHRPGHLSMRHRDHGSNGKEQDSGVIGLGLALLVLFVLMVAIFSRRDGWAVSRPKEQYLNFVQPSGEGCSNPDGVMQPLLQYRLDLAGHTDGNAAELAEHGRAPSCKSAQGTAGLTPYAQDCWDPLLSDDPVPGLCPRVGEDLGPIVYNNQHEGLPPNWNLPSLRGGDAPSCPGGAPRCPAACGSPDEDFYDVSSTSAQAGSNAYSILWKPDHELEVGSWSYSD
jgi:hypothetical protein